MQSSVKIYAKLYAAISETSLGCRLSIQLEL
jgi:hypothetical protein